MPDTEPSLIEDATVPTIFFDGLAQVEARAGVMRMIAYILRVNPVSGIPERLPVAVLIRPVEATQEIRAAIRGASCEPCLSEFPH